MRRFIRFFFFSEAEIDKDGARLWSGERDAAERDLGARELQKKEFPPPKKKKTTLLSWFSSFFFVYAFRCFSPRLFYFRRPKLHYTRKKHS